MEVLHRAGFVGGEVFGGGVCGGGAGWGEGLRVVGWGGGLRGERVGSGG